MKKTTLTRINLLVTSVVLSTAYAQESSNTTTVDNPYKKYVDKGEVYADWETGEWQSGFKGYKGAIASFSTIGVDNSKVAIWNPEPDEKYDASIHNIEVVEMDGSKVLKIWSDGTNRAPKGQWNPSVPYSNRSEISWNRFMTQQPNEESYITYQYKPGDSWDKKSIKWQTIITQYKEFSSGPFFEILLSNDGLNTNNKIDVYVIGGKPQGTTTRIIEKTKIGEIDPDSWTTVKIYVKTTTEADGAIKVWLNGGDKGKPTFAYEGRTLLKGNNSYTKFGHYGQIFNSKVSYFDNLHITKKIDTSLKKWVKASAELE